MHLTITGFVAVALIAVSQPPPPIARLKQVLGSAACRLHCARHVINRNL